MGAKKRPIPPLCVLATAPSLIMILSTGTTALSRGRRPPRFASSCPVGSFLAMAARWRVACANRRTGGPDVSRLPAIEGNALVFSSGHFILNSEIRD